MAGRNATERFGRGRGAEAVGLVLAKRSYKAEAEDDGTDYASGRMDVHEESK